MSYCSSCGAAEPDAPAIIAENPEPEAAAELTRAEVEIAKIQAERDVKLARIGAGIDDASRDQALARAQGEAGVLKDIITPDPAPVVVTDPVPVPEPEPEPDPEGDNEPPVITDDGPPPGGGKSANPWF